MTKNIRASRKTPHVGNKPPQTIRESDLRIKDAIRILTNSSTGQTVLAQFKTFSKGAVRNLDMSGQAAIVTLLKELTFGSRRDFVHLLPSDPSLQEVESVAIEFGYKCCEKGMNLDATFLKANELRSGKPSSENLAKKPKARHDEGCPGWHDHRDCTCGYSK